jgi:acyl-CoA synthetase (AMP-forming)/AMP-acid ligase II
MDSFPKRDGNHVPLSPITFLTRAASAYADRTSLIYGSTTFTWMQTYQRCCRLAAALQEMAVSKNDVVRSMLNSFIPFIIPTLTGVSNTFSH